VDNPLPRMARATLKAVKIDKTPLASMQPGTDDVDRLLATPQREGFLSQKEIKQQHVRFRHLPLVTAETVGSPPIERQGFINVAEGYSCHGHQDPVEAVLDDPEPLVEFSGALDAVTAL